MAGLGTTLVTRRERRDDRHDRHGNVEQEDPAPRHRLDDGSPTTGPATVAALVQAVQAPIARPASSLYVARSSARLPGVSSAPKIPWMARAAISTSLVGASRPAPRRCEAGHADDERVRVAVPVSERPPGDTAPRARVSS